MMESMWVRLSLVYMKIDINQAPMHLCSKLSRVRRFVIDSRACARHDLEYASGINPRVLFFKLTIFS